MYHSESVWAETMANFLSGYITQLLMHRCWSAALSKKDPGQQLIAECLVLGPEKHIPLGEWRYMKMWNLPLRRISCCSLGLRACSRPLLSDLHNLPCRMIWRTSYYELQMCLAVGLSLFCLSRIEEKPVIPCRHDLFYAMWSTLKHALQNECCASAFF